MVRMSEASSFDFTSENFDAYQRDTVGVINLKSGVYEMTINLPVKEELFARIKMANRLPEIKVLMILSGETVLGEGKFVEWERSLRESSDGRMNLIREENALLQYLRLVCCTEKIVVSAVCGSVIGTFLGAMLATDYRIACENTIFSFQDLKYEMSSPGALGFFLPKYVGFTNAKKILFSGESLTVAKAHEMGLIDDMVPADMFEKKCIEIARELSNVPPAVVHMAKRMGKGNLAELDAYFKMESK